MLLGDVQSDKRKLAAGNRAIPPVQSLLVDRFLQVKLSGRVELCDIWNWRVRIRDS